MNEKTILIVEDFNSTRMAIRHTLERQGYGVIEASNGIEALELLDGRTIHLIVSDYNMPGLNGIELVREVRNMTVYEYIPILILTTETDESKREEAKESGVTGWIIKPYKVDEFIKVIHRMVH